MNAPYDAHSLPPMVKETSRLERYFQFLGRKWWVVLLMVCLCAGGQFLYLMDQPPVYDSYARLMLGGKVKVQEGYSFSEDLMNYFGTQIELLQSEKIRDRAMARLKVEHPELKEAPIKLQATQLRRTSMILLHAWGPDGSFTRAFLDALVDEYLGFKKEMRASVSDDTLASLTGKLLEQEKTLKSDQETLHNFKRDNNVSVLQEVTSAAGAYLAKLKTEMAELRMEESVLKLLTDNDKVLPQTAIAEGKSAGETRDNSDSKAANAAAGQVAPPDYQAAKQQAQWLKLQRDQWSEFMRPEHPKMIKLNEEISKLEKLVDFFRDQGRDQLTSSLERLRLKINATAETIKDWEVRVVDANSRMTDYDKLRITVARSQALYDQLLRLLQNVDVNKNIDQESMNVLQRASLPIEQERLSLRLAVAGAVGLFLGLGILMLWERRDDRLFSLAEFRQQFEEPVVCQVPQVPRKWRKGATAMINQMDLHSLFAESFRHLHSSLVLGSQPRSVLVTSAVSGEGKSTTALNLAMTAALNGSRVLLIDADVHRGKMHELLEAGPGRGLADYRTEEATAELPVVLTRVNNLWLMPCGGQIPGDGSFLNSATLEELTRIYREYDFVVVDSPPVFAGDDALRLGQTVDGVLLVIRSAYSRAGAITRILEQLYQRRAKVLGFVLNGVDDNVDHCHRYRQKEYRKLIASN